MALAEDITEAAEKAVIAEIGRNAGRRSAHWEARAAVAATLRTLADAKATVDVEGLLLRPLQVDSYGLRKLADEIDGGAS